MYAAFLFLMEFMYRYYIYDIAGNILTVVANHILKISDFMEIKLWLICLV